MRLTYHCLFVWCVLLALCATVFAATPITATIFDPATGEYTAYETTTVDLICDGAPLETDMPAILVDGRTMVPVRVISEQLGCAVVWKQDSQTVVIQSGDSTIQLIIGDPIALVDGIETPLYDGVAPTLVQIDGGGRTMVPLRFISESLGANIDWNQDTQTASIATNKAFSGEVSLPIATEDGIFIATTGDLTPTIFELPQRVVLDFPDGLLEGGTLGSLALDDHTAITSIRYNQYDNGYVDYDRVARVVLDMAEGFDLSHLSILSKDTGISITMASDEVPSEEIPEEEYVENEEAVDDLETDVVEPSEDGGSEQEHPKLEEDVPELEAEGLTEEEEAPQEVIPLYSVMLDAGHGGEEVSATHFGVDEKTVTLPIALKTGQLLEAAGFAVSYTRTEDVKVTLQERVDMANDQAVDIFISIHANAFPTNPDIAGIETYYLYEGEGGKDLASAIQTNLMDATDAANRGIKAAGYYVVTHTLMPAVLSELGFLTNEEECMKLIDEDYQWQLAVGIANGVLAYFET